MKIFHKLVGTIGPGSIPLANRPSLRALMGQGLKASRLMIVNRPRNARATLRQGARAPLTPDASFPEAPWYPDTYHPGRPLFWSALVPGYLLPRTPPLPMCPSAQMSLHPDASFLDQRLYQAKLLTGSP